MEWLIRYLWNNQVVHHVLGPWTMLYLIRLHMYISQPVSCCSWSGLLHITLRTIENSSLVPRPLPRFYLAAVKKNREKAWDQNYVTDWKWWTRLYKQSPRYVLTESTISGLWRSFDPRPAGLLPIFLHGCKIKSGRGLGTRLWPYMVVQPCYY